MAAAACSGGGKAKPEAGAPPPADGGVAADGGAAETGPLAFEADPPTVYVAKVKNLLVGLPPTADEVSAVTADPTQLEAAHRLVGCSCPSTRRRCSDSSSWRSSRRR